MTTDSIPIIDTHQHLWDLNRVRLAWLSLEGKSDVLGLDRSFLVEDYLKAVREKSVAVTIYMEVNVVLEDQNREVDYVLGLCESDDNPIRAAGCWENWI